MKRRSFLGRALAGVAALAAVGRMPKPAAASPLDTDWDDVPEFNEPLGAPMTHAQLAQAFRARATTLTFEAMQADCASRGCELYVSADGYLRHWFDGPGHMIGEWPGKMGTLTPYGLSRVDAWRRSLHDALIQDLVSGRPLHETAV